MVVTKVCLSTWPVPFEIVSQSARSKHWPKYLGDGREAAGRQVLALAALGADVVCVMAGALERGDAAARRRPRTAGRSFRRPCRGAHRSPARRPRFPWSLLAVGFLSGGSGGALLQRGDVVVAGGVSGERGGGARAGRRRTPWERGGPA